ncbi:MAG: C-terminal target protein [Segetibacter sp.]|nr:C-terminal target protein [Segetibacter sp.]
MKRFALLLITQLLLVLAYTQPKIKGYEYWFDADYANKVPTNITPAKTYTLNTGITTTGLSTGLHIFNIHFIDDSSRYSSTASSYFYSYKSSYKISSYEYWIDDDYTNKVAQSITPTTIVNLNTEINVSSLSGGLHRFNIRFKDEGGTWNSTVSNYFFVKVGGNALLNGYEYWFDDDYINKVAQNISASNVATLITEINTTSLNSGIHRFNIRFKDANGYWSSSVSNYFYTNSKGGNSLVSGYEYWFDNNYNATISQTLTPSQILNLSTSINVDSLSSGFHIFNIRVKDSSNIWSSVESSYFVKTSFTGTNLITGYRYWFDNKDTTIKNFPVPTPAPLVQLDTNINAASLTIGVHNLNIQFRDTAQLWSSVLTYDFYYCLSGLPISNFNYAISGTDVSFINGSQNMTALHWSFGDGDTSNLNNPLHHFTPGVYNVCLIANNSCNPEGDTICKAITVAGLASINSNHGGNTGYVSVKITGAGFRNGMKLYLNKSDEKIYGDTLIVRSSTIMQTTFNLIGKSTGIYDVVAIYPSGDTATIKKGFTIETGVQPKLWVTLTGPQILRMGFNQTYTVTYGNTGNVDALFVPLLITGLPLGSNIEILNPLFKMSSIKNFDSMSISPSSFRHTITDSQLNRSFRLFYIIKIPAGATQTLNFIFHLPNNTALLQYVPKIEAILGKPIDNSILDRARLNSSNKLNFDLDDAACIASIIDAGVNLALEVSGIRDWVKCSIGLAQHTKTVINLIINSFDEDASYGDVVLDGAEFAVSTTATAWECLKAAEIFVPTSTIVKAIDLGILMASNSLAGAGIARECMKALANNSIRPTIGSSWDPNEKYGLGDNSTNHFIADTAHLNYVINFENAPTSNLNAQTVKVLDTLNPKYFNFKTFGFTSVSIGDSILSLPFPVKVFYHDFNFVAAYGVKARVTATFDTITGIAQWTFNSIDPSTNQTTTNPLVGFLPPDVASPKGQGYVSYVVGAQPYLHNGDTIYNRASIIFDYNSPVVTNRWQNVLDLVKPISKVNTLPFATHKQKFKVSWSGSDNLSGIREYGIYMSVNDSAFVPWRLGTTQIGDTVIGEYGNKYSFYSLAKDNAGNVEMPKSAAEAAITVTLTLPDSTCSGESVHIVSEISGTSNTYQWQVDEGTGYTNVTNSGIYSGATKDTLKIIAVPNTTFALYRYRCIVTNEGIKDTTTVHVLHIVNIWTGAVSVAWENAANWSCGSVPDANTDVIINTGTSNNPVINQPAECRSLRLSNSLLLTVKSTLDIKGKTLQ